MKNLVVGAGLAGAVLAERIAARLNEEVLVIERKSHVGGICYDYKDAKTGIIVQPYTQICHTNQKYIWDYLSEFTDWKFYSHMPGVVVQGQTISFPITLKSLYDTFPEQFARKLEDKLISKFGYNARISVAELSRNFDDDLKFLSNYFYENVFKPVTVKQLGIDPENIPPCSDAPFPIYISKDARAYHDKYQAVPKNGYNAMIENILNHKKIKLKLNTEYTDINPEKYDRIFYTGSIDEYFDYKYGELPYRSLRFETVEEDTSLYQDGVDVLTHPLDYDFIRTVEHKLLRNQQAPTTIVTFEYPETFELGKNERFYPINSEESKELLEKYLEEASELSNVYFVGRLGDFKSYNVAESVNKAFETVAKIIAVKNSYNEETVQETSE